MFSLFTWDNIMDDLWCLYVGLGRYAKSRKLLFFILNYCNRNWKNKWEVKQKIRNQYNNSSSMLRTLFTVLQWREPLRSWREWSCKMLTKKNLKIINITKILLRIQRAITMVQFCLSGVSQLKRVEESMLLQSAGIQDTRIYSQLVMVHMISWNRIQVSFAVTLLKTPHGLSTHTPLSQVLCALIIILDTQLYLL